MRDEERSKRVEERRLRKKDMRDRKEWRDKIEERELRREERMGSMSDLFNPS